MRPQTTRGIDATDRPTGRTWRAAPQWRRTLPVWGPVLVMVCLGVSVVACGGAASSGQSVGVSPAASSVQPHDATSAGSDQTAEALRNLARRVAPMAVYGWEETPPGVEISAQWLPVIEEADPVPNGSSEANPRVVGEGLPDPEAEMVFSYQGGWLVLVENFRGDLGETPGSPVGNVGGEPAAVYSVNGGVLVQWSHDGRWYGLFGRGVAQEKVVALALMVVYFAVDGGAGRVGYRRNPPIDGGLRKV